jgi:hypothetical protein
MSYDPDEKCEYVEHRNYRQWFRVEGEPGLWCVPAAVLAANIANHRPETTLSRE